MTQKALNFAMELDSTGAVADYHIVETLNIYRNLKLGTDATFLVLKGYIDKASFLAGRKHLLEKALTIPELPVGDSVDWAYNYLANEPTLDNFAGGENPFFGAEILED